MTYQLTYVNVTGSFPMLQSQGSMGISTGVERREHFTDLQISSKKPQTNKKC